MGVHSIPIGERIEGDAVRHFLNLDFQSYGRGFVSYTPSEQIIRYLLAGASNFITNLASADLVMQIFRHNPETIVAFSRGAWRVAPGDGPMGFWCHLPLNADGHDALFDGRLVTTNPDLRFICRQSEKPAAIYHWLVYSEPKIFGALSLVMERFTSDKHRGLPMYCRAATATAHALFLRSGFKQGAKHKHYVDPGIMTLEPPDPAAGRPIYDTYISNVPGNAKRHGIKVAHTVHELMVAASIRGAAYVAERLLPVYDDMDGNDISATHLIGYIGDDPVGCIRIRYFADFVKLERLALIPQHRGRMAFTLARAAIAFAQMKGYRRFYGQASEPYVKLWKHLGFTQREGDGLTHITDEVYFEIDLITAEPTIRLTPDSGGLVLVRREGQWDRPGAYEQGEAS